MNDVEYILRIILKARDDMALVLSKARTQLRGFTQDANRMNSAVTNLNQAMKNFDTNLHGITQKLEAWRATLRDTDKDGKDLAKTFDTVGKNADASSKKVGQAAQATKDLNIAANKLRSDYEKLAKQEDINDKNRAYTVLKLKETAAELDKLAKKVSDPALGRFWANWAQQSRDAAEEILDDRRRLARELERLDKKALADEEKAQKDHQTFLDDLEKKRVATVKLSNAAIAREIEQQITAEERAGKDKEKILADAEKRRVAMVKLANAEISRGIEQQIKDEENAASAKQSILDRRRSQEEQRIRLARESARIEREGNDPSAVKRLASEYDKLGRAYRVGSFRAREFGNEAERLRTTIRASSSDTDRSASMWTRFSKSISNAGDGVAGFDNQARGMGLLLATASIQQLMSAAIALGGELVSLAGSAAMAGGALGGILAAGAAQALPVIGLLAGAMSRVKGVMDAFQQSQLLQKAQFTDAQKSQEKSIDQTNALANAQDSAAAAADNLAEARKGLTQAQADGVRQLEDLIYQEKAAALAAKGASLNVKEAQKALQDAIRGGASALEVQQRQQSLDEARQSAGRSRVTARRATQDRRAAGGEVSGLESVQQAAKAVETAQRGVERANRSLDQAADKTDRLASSTMTAQANLDYLLSQMSPAERKLYTAFQALYDNYKKVFVGDEKTNGIYGVITSAFTRAVEKANEIIGQPDVVKSFQGLASSIADAFNKLTDSFSDPETIDQFQRIMGDAGKNMGPLVDGVVKLGHAFLEIAEAANPAFQLLIEYVGDVIDKFTGLTGDSSKLEDFFTSGEEHLESWLDLLLAIIGLFGTLVGASAEEGKTSIDDLTKKIQGWTDWLDSHRKDVTGFFEDARDAAYAVGSVVEELATTLFETFNAESVKNFADILKTSVIPAIGELIDTFGKVVDAVTKFADNPIGAQIIKWAIVFGIFMKVAGGVVGLFGKFVGSIVGIVENFSKLAKFVEKIAEKSPALKAFLEAFSKVGARALPFVGWGIAIALLLKQFGLLDDAWDEIKQAAGALWGQIEPPLKRFMESFQRLITAVKEGEGAFSVIVPVLREFLELVVEIGGFILEGIAKAVGQVIGGVIDILGGVIDIITGIMTGDFGLIWEGIKDILLGVANAAIGLFELLFFKGMGKIFKGLPKLAWSALKELPSLFVKAFELAWDLIKGFPGRWFELAKDVLSLWWKGYRLIGSLIKRGVELAWDFLKALPGRWFDLAKDIVSLFWRGYKAIGRFLRKGIEDVWGWLKGLPKRLGDLAIDAVKLFVNAFKGLGGKIIGAISEGISGAGNFAKKLINGIFKLIEDGWNKGIGGKKVLGVSLPDIHIPRLAEGGAIPGSGSGDTVPALLTPGEHVLTKREVQAAGGHEVIFALRRMLGGGGQALGFHFQPGGVVDPRTGLMHGAAAAEPQVDDSRVREEFKKSTTERAENWRTMWNDMLVTTRRYANDIETQFREMRVNTAASSDRMYRDIRGSVRDIQNSFAVRGNAIIKTWSATWFSLMTVASEGLTYIGHETNKALIALGEKNINFGLTKPKQENLGQTGHMAFGGMIGNKGERGRDAGLYALGRGEAVLNWAHQSYVEPAMHAYYGHGLGTMFQRVRGYHAGGPEQHGMAGGGHAEIDKTGRWAANEQLARVVVAMMRRWKFALTAAGEQGHAANSDHHWGGALDIIPGPGGSWGLLDQLAHAAGWRPNAPMPSSGPFRWIGWNTEAGHGEGNHLHLSWRREGPFTGPGGAGGAGDVGEAITEIGRVLVIGANKLKDIAQGGLDKVREAANKKLDESGGGTTASSLPLGPGGVQEKVFNYFTGRGLSEAIAAGFVGVFHKESNFSTTVANAAGSGATGLAQWLGGRLAALKQKKNWQTLQTQLDFVWEELQGPESAAFRLIKGAKTAAEAARIIDSAYERSDGLLDAPEYATKAYHEFASSPDHGPRKSMAEGGTVPGPDGTPIPILAHAGEWILNKGQQVRAAMLAGMSVGGLKGMLGFWGSGGHFQGGGAPDSTRFGAFRPVSREAAVQRSLDRGIDTYNKMIDDVIAMWKAVEKSSASARRQKKGDKALAAFQKGIDAIDKIAGEGGVIEQMGTEIAAQFERAGTKLRAAALKVGDVVTRSGMTDVQVVQKGLDNLVENYNDLVGERGTIHDALKTTNDEITRVKNNPKLKKDQKKKLLDQLSSTRTGLIGKLDELDKQLVESAEARLQAQIDVQQAVVDEITKRRDKVTQGLELVKRIASAVGSQGMLDKANQGIADNIAGTVKELQDRVAAARAAGATDLADKLEADIAEMKVAAFEAAQQAIQDQIDTINQSASRQLSRLDLFGRMADALGVIGDKTGVQVGGRTMSRASVFDARRGVLDEQRAGIVGQREVLRAGTRDPLTGALLINQKKIDELTDQIDELDVSIAENTHAAREARYAGTQATFESASRLNDLNKQLVEATDAVTGQTSSAKLLALAQERQTLLDNRTIEITAELADARAAGDEKAAQALQEALLENQIAVQNNTKAVNELTGAGSAPSSFTSLLETWFGEAFLTGTGHLLPQFTPPTGLGTVGSGPGSVSNTNNTNGNTYNTYVEVNEAGGPVDVTQVASGVAYAQATAPR